MTTLFWKLQVRPVPWSLGDAGLGFVIVLAGVFVAAMVLVGLGVTGAGATGQDTAVTLLVTGLAAVLMIGTAWALGVRKHGVSLAALGFTLPRGLMPYLLAVVALGLSLGFTALYSTVVSELGVEVLQPPDIDDSFLANGGNVVFSALMVIEVDRPEDGDDEQTSTGPAAADLSRPTRRHREGGVGRAHLSRAGQDVCHVRE